MKKIDISLNTTYPLESNLEWRLLIDGLETLVNDIRCETPTYTTSIFIEGHGMKSHMSTFAHEVEINQIDNKIIALIK